MVVKVAEEQNSAIRLRTKLAKAPIFFMIIARVDTE